jgi:hypothetical protein
MIFLSLYIEYLIKFRPMTDIIIPKNPAKGSQPARQTGGQIQSMINYIHKSCVTTGIYTLLPKLIHMLKLSSKNVHYRNIESSVSVAYRFR